MLIEKIYLGLILLFFVLAFTIKNITTYFSTKTSIRGQSTKLTISIALSTIIYVLVAMRILILEPNSIFELDFRHYPVIKIAGYSMVSIGFVMGLLSLITMKSSWRVGIKYDQKTTLITNGIYRFSRNPYFFSYDILILGYILIYPSPVLAFLYLLLVVIFHMMIIEEEKYLLSIHGNEYHTYQQKVNRYFTFK